MPFLCHSRLLFKLLEIFDILIVRIEIYMVKYAG